MIIIILVCLNSAKESSQLGEILRQWEDCITRSDKQSQKYLDMIIQTYVIPKEYESRFYRLYGQYILYGLDNKNFIDFPKAYYYFKLSAQTGNTKAQFYLALLENYKLDGSFALMQNLNQTEYREIFSYVKNSHHSNSLIDLYFASTQGNFQASIALGFKHLYGIGMDGNCSNAALYFLPVAEFQSHRRDKFHIEERNLGQLLYDSDFFLSYELNSEEFLEIFQNLGQVTHDSIHQVKQTAYNFYYGLNGVKKDFQKAFQLYQKIAEETNDVGAKITVAEMILEGLGNNDYKQAFQYLQINDPTSKENLGRAFNSLGYMYFNGLHVSKSLSKAQEYFLKSSEYDNSNGHFNLASLLVLPSTLERERNKKQAIIHYQNAVAHGHPQALYSLGMILLDGVDLFYSCELGATLLHKSVLRNEWAEVLNHAIHLFRSEQYKKSFIRYLEAAFLGHSNGFQNAAVVAQLYKGLYIPSDLYTNIDMRLQNDIVYKIMNHSTKASQYIYSEILNFDQDFNLTAYLDFDQDKYIGWLTFHLYVYCKREKDAFCTIKVADHYYYGQYYDRNYNKSYNIYTEALSYNTIPTMRAHIYFNLGIMSALGEGVEQNLTLSKIYFKQSLDEYHVIPAIPQIIILKLIDICFQVYIKEQSITDLIIKNVSLDQIQNQFNEILKSLTSMILVGMIVFLFAYKLRIQNSIK